MSVLLFSIFKTLNKETAVASNLIFNSPQNLQPNFSFAISNNNYFLHYNQRWGFHLKSIDSMQPCLRYMEHKSHFFFLLVVATDGN